MRLIVTASALLIFCTVFVFAADWPQYRGPQGDGICAGNAKLALPASADKVVWKIETKNGFSSFAIANGVAYTQVNRDVNGGPREMLVALDAKTGKELWAADMGIGTYDGGGDDGAPNNDGGDGPRSTPTVDGGKVYVYNQSLVLSCFDAKTGKLLWSRDVTKEHAGQNIGWKSAMSPVIDGDLLFVGGGGPGQSMLGLNKATGAVVWKAHDEMITHATPVVATIQGVRQVIFFMQSGLVAVAPKDGALLWRFPMKHNVSTAASPVVDGDIVYCSAGYGVGGAACRLLKEDGKLKPVDLYRIPGDKQIANHWSTPVLYNGHLYGMFSFKKYGTGPLKCVDIATGKVKWEKSGFGAGNVILAGNTVVALSDDGQVVLVEAVPAAYKELGRLKVLEGKCWSTPAIAEGRLYVRSTKEGACLDLTGK